MKLFRRNLFAVFALVVCSLISRDVFAQNEEIDDMYFSERDRQESPVLEYSEPSKSKTSTQNSNYSATFPTFEASDENYSSSNVNPEYIEKYRKQAEEARTGYAREAEGTEASYNADTQVDSTGFYSQMFSAADYSMDKATYDRYAAKPEESNRYYTNSDPQVTVSTSFNYMGGYGYGSSFGIGIGWGMNPHWNMGFNYGFGYPFYDPFYDPWYNPWSPWGHPYYGYNPFYPRYGNGWGWGHYPPYYRPPVIIVPPKEGNSREVVRGRPSNRTSGSTVDRSDARSGSSPSRANSRVKYANDQRDYTSTQNEYYKQSRRQASSGTNRTYESRSQRTTQNRSYNASRSSNSQRTYNRSYNNSNNNRSQSSRTYNTTPKSNNRSSYQRSSTQRSSSFQRSSGGSRSSGGGSRPSRRN
ncbi:hypothetical protein [Aureibacter tunicatorum]|uniref:Secreted protein n=1 Tax=Aureibacter tunicatorum TaxID=866807 RepID=A0AAE4BNR9_9BACT|nr:hypothetical protein [Aureibacter tunicatorum]MDR6237129.1 hypothetical protein [Aureibacter tunicatorum]BDD06121.1 hypothetical protein AUTU_36040 [Aureibacter tunicatorum]